MVSHADTKEKFAECLRCHDKVAVLFSAVWCDPCSEIKPMFKAQADKYPDIKFVDVDTDENEDTAMEYEVEAMPAFKFFHKQAELKDMDILGGDQEGFLNNLCIFNEKK